MSPKKTMDKTQREKLIKKLKLKKLLFRTFMYFTTTTMGMSPTVSTYAPVSNIGSDDKKFKDKNELITNAINSTDYLKNVNVEAEVSKRVEWIFCKHIEALENHLNVLGEKGFEKRTKKRNAYIKENFFSKANPEAGFSDPRYYCMAAIFGTLNDVTSQHGGDLLNLIPNENTLSCSQLVYLRHNPEYKDYIKHISGVTKVKKTLDECKVGDVILKPSTGNTSSGWHAMTYAGKDEKGEHQAIGFNNEYKGEFKAPSSIWVIKLNEIAKTKLLESTKNLNKIEFLTVIYSGMENAKVPDIQNDSTKFIDVRFFNGRKSFDRM